MTGRVAPAPWKALVTGALLFAAGAVAGIVADRLLLEGGTPPPGLRGPGPVTVEALSRDLDLSDAEAARLAATLDSVRASIHAAARAGPDSLRTAARRARARLEAAVPAERRDDFLEWMMERRRGMMGRMGPMRGPGTGPRGGRMGPGMGPGQRMMPPPDGTDGSDSGGGVSPGRSGPRTP